MSTPFEAFGLVVAALLLKLVATTGVQGVVRLRHRAFVRPEDAAFFGKGVAALEREHVLVERAQNVLRNDGENVPLFLALLLAFAHVDGRPTHVLAYGLAFVATRVVHTLAYLRPTQPLRNRAYVLGLGIMLALAVQLVVVAF
ncbi:MAG: MAPEG family protein [Myxococcales bacterium]|nr:MAPEG family protein [Myxococcales bacterium]